MTAGPWALIAHRIVPVASDPSARTTVRSETGSHGSRSGPRVQRGISPTAAATSTRYGARASAGSGGLSSRKRTASRASWLPRSSGR